MFTSTITINYYKFYSMSLQIFYMGLVIYTPAIALEAGKILFIAVHVTHELPL